MKEKLKVLILGLVELIGSKLSSYRARDCHRLNPWFSGIDWFRNTLRLLKLSQVS